MDQVNATNGSHTTNGTVVQDEDWTQTVTFKLRTSILLLIVIMAVLGNLLVIVSVMRHRFVVYYFLNLSISKFKYLRDRTLVYGLEDCISPPCKFVYVYVTS